MEFYLDSNNDAFVFDDLGEQDALVRLLVQCLMEEDNSTHTLGDGWVDGEEEVTEVATVFLSVFYFDVLKTLAHGTWKKQTD